MTNMNTLEVLMKARAKIGERKAWAGNFRELREPGKNCMVTAVYQCGVHHYADPPYQALIRATETSKGLLHHFNDTHSHFEVLAAFDRAIEAEWEKVQGAAEPIVREPVVA